MTGSWQPIETAPRSTIALFWIVPKAAHESYVDTSGKPIVGDFEPYMSKCAYGWWSSLSKATHWHPLPGPPEVR